MMSPTTTAVETSKENSTANHNPSFVISSADGLGTVDENKSQCSSLSDVENYEWTAENADLDSDTTTNVNGNSNPSETTSPSNGINRNSWLRTSLRRSPNSQQDNISNRRWSSFRHSGRRQQLGSHALASQLYRSSSFNSSGRSSTCDTTDDMHSDASLEEDVHELHNKFHLLQQQVGVLQDNANQNDERYTRTKADNAALQARVIMLEEQLRDTELRYEEKLQDEQRRYKELLARMEREKQLQLENASIRLHASEMECSNLKEEITRQRTQIDRFEIQRQEMVDQIQDLTNELNQSKEEVKILKEHDNRLKRDYDIQTQLIDELSKEIERLRTETRTPALPTTSPEILRLEELHEEMSALRAENTHLQEANEELQASLLHAGLETGRMLTIRENNLAAELEVMSQDEVQKALKEQQEVNRQLRTYIEGILLNIVENHPQLLEVKHQRPIK
ncbi:hypothetical protein NQ315_016102 [Exocentrus adspersus]|uniref:FIP-RBD domain-containing protein n=1 Tax=Exocentrus adspersus TaxID=1586481 RepID=A0AAV8V7T1_9CUCU|nr:hypothetical protein NQ315_016102 [Exocentrus adspersus]